MFYFQIGLLGTIFVNSLKAIAPILVCVLIISSLSQAKTDIGSRFKTVILIYISCTFIAALVAIVMSMTFPVTIQLTTASSEPVPNDVGRIIADLILGIFSNPLNLLVNGEYLGILFWSLVTGVALKYVASDTTKRCFNRLCQYNFINYQRHYSICTTWYHGVSF